MEGQLGWEILEEGWRKGPWTAEEDKLLIEYVRIHGEGRWNSVARFAGLKRNGKSCRLRWVNYLRPDLKRGRITPHEEKIIVELHARWGNRWSTIARSLPGRTDNEIKNYWRTHFKKKGKGSLEQSEKAKHRLFRRQQFQYQQKQQQQQQQQQQKYQEDQDDMKKVMSLLDMYPNNCEEPCLLSSMFNGSHISVPAAPTEDFNIWDGLWNLDNLSASLDAMYAPNKASMQTSTIKSFC